MKKYLLPSIKLTLVFIMICSVFYPLFIAAVGKLTPGKGGGETIKVNGKVVGYANIGQKFTDDKYFWGRPSAVEYNAAGSGGSNKGPSNPDYLKTVENRIDTFLAHNSGIARKQIPSEMVTASGSGLDPDISPASAYLQVRRIATIRGLPESKVKELVTQHVVRPLMGIFGPPKVNVLKLNVALNRLNP